MRNLRSISFSVPWLNFTLHLEKVLKCLRILKWQAYTINQTLAKFDVNLRDVVEGVDDDEAERHEKDDSRRNDVGGDEKADPRHDDEDGCRQVHVQEVGRHAPRQLDLHPVNGIVTCKKRIILNHTIHHTM